MAPPKTFMIAPQFPGYLYDTAAAPGPLAHWTSAPSYSYEQFARSNPRPEREERAARKGRKGRHHARLNSEHAIVVWANYDRPWGDIHAYRETAEGRETLWFAVNAKDREFKGTEAEVIERAKAVAQRLHSQYPNESIGVVLSGEDLARPEIVHRIAPKVSKKRVQAGQKARLNGAPEAYDVADNAGPFLPGMFPYGVGGHPAAYGPSGYEAAERRAKPNPGRYADVLRQHGRAGFGIPRNAPNEGSFPLYPIKRARYALAVVASPSFDSHPDTREQVIRAAVKAHPELKAEAQHVLARVGDRIGHRAAANGKRRK